MHCPDFESRLQAILDDRRDPAADDALLAHAAWCEPCQDLLNDQLAVLTTIARLKRAGLISRRPKPAASRLRVVPVGPFLTVAAAMLIALGLVWQIRGRHSRVGEVAGGSRRALNVGRAAGGLAMTVHNRPAAKPASISAGTLLLEAPRLPEHLRSYGGRLEGLAVSLPAAFRNLDDVDEFAPGLSNLRASFGLIWQTLVHPIPPSPSSEHDAARRERTGGLIAGPLLNVV